MSENAELIENAKLDIKPVVDYLKEKEPEIRQVASRLAELRAGLYSLYTGQVEGAVDQLQMIAYDYEEGSDEAYDILNSLTADVNELGMGIGIEGGYLWVPSTRSC